ncbi:MAG: efflux RND transporter periplasmic adaptor subunit, partial [Colwellia sp.]|nr:efflux RND transporter periplasmic adaptor subunit [Colwellia sp.]
MRNKWIRVLLPIAVIGFFVAGYIVINATAKVEDEKAKVDTRPTVKTQTMAAEEHQVIIKSYGEVKPLESTLLATQVSGEVTHWNPKFIVGGFVKRGEVLFNIDPDNYHASVLESEAAVANAQSLLIQEKANAHVAREEANRIPNSKPSDLYLRKPQLLSANAALKSAQARLKRAQRDLAKCAVKAPFDALIISKNIGLGQFVNVGSQVAILNNIETAEVTVPVPGFD